MLRWIQTNSIIIPDLECAKNEKDKHYQIGSKAMMFIQWNHLILLIYSTFSTIKKANVRCCATFYHLISSLGVNYTNVYKKQKSVIFIVNTENPNLLKKKVIRNSAICCKVWSNVYWLTEYRETLTTKHQKFRQFDIKSFRSAYRNFHW